MDLINLSEISRKSTLKSGFHFEAKQTGLSSRGVELKSRIKKYITYAIYTDPPPPPQ